MPPSDAEATRSPRSRQRVSFALGWLAEPDHAASGWIFHHVSPHARPENGIAQPVRGPMPSSPYHSLRSRSRMYSRTVPCPDDGSTLTRKCDVFGEIDVLKTGRKNPMPTPGGRMVVVPARRGGTGTARPQPG
jgi:hypothetical protein